MTIGLYHTSPETAASLADEAGGCDEGAEFAFGLDLLLDAVADAEKLSVSDTELDADLKRRARGMGVAFAELKSQLAKNDRLDGIREELRIDKALELLLTEAVAAS